MWNNGHYLIWERIVKILHYELANGVKYTTKITANHVQLKSSFCMNAKLATQVLIVTFLALLNTYYGQENKELLISVSTKIIFFIASMSAI